MELAVQIVEPRGAESKHRGASDVVLIHGTGSSNEMWKAQTDMLSDYGYRCFIPDLRGHGLSDEPEEPTSIAVHQQDVLDTLAKLDIKYPAIFIGHSLGAILSLTIAEQRPEMFEQIFAVGMPGKVLPAIAAGFKLFLSAPFEKLRGTPLHASMGWRERTMINTNRHALTQIVENFANIDYVTTLPQVQCPVHFAVGRLDPVAPHFYVEKMHKAMSNSTLQVFEWAGHNCMDQYPTQFNAWLRRYLPLEDKLN